MFRGVECREPLKLAPTPPNIRYAVNLRGEIINAIERGTFNYAEHFPRSKNAARFGFAQSGKTVGMLLDEYEAIASKAVSPSTWKGYKKVITRCLRPWFADVRVIDVTPSMLKARLLAEDVTIKTARNILTPLSVALRVAVDDGELKENPVDRLSLRAIWPKDRRRSGWRPDPFNFAEMEAIFAACEPGEVEYWRFAFGTGLRPSEQMALDWRQCDLRLGRVRVDQAQVMGIDGSVIKETKTSAGQRTVVLSNGAWEAIERQFDSVGGNRTEGRVFMDWRTGTPWADEGALRKRWVRILKKAKVRYRNPYQTRHTFASAFLAAGYPALWVAKQMGHEGTGMLNKHYGHWIEQGAEPATRAALAAFFSHPSPTPNIVVPFMR